MKPASVRASGIRVGPTSRTIDRVMTCTAPVCFRASATIEPSTITTPICPRVLPKPRWNAWMKLFCWTPGTMPNRMIGSSSAKKTCQRSFAMRNRRSTMTAVKAASAMRGLAMTAVEGSISGYRP